MQERRSSILFLSGSSAVFDTIPEECFSKYDFYLLKINKENSIKERFTNKDLIIIDTYSLGVDFLDMAKELIGERNIPILIIDDFDNHIIINQLFAKGAKGYLNIDDYSSGIKTKIQKLIQKSGMLVL
ncbi:MAG: hypothetical protein AAGF85_00850 [Bacteroidota bacterium]